MCPYPNKEQVAIEMVFQYHCCIKPNYDVLAEADARDV